MKEILLVYTGGTICSLVDETTGHKNSDREKAQHLLIAKFRKSASLYAGVFFADHLALDILSENMTLSTWNILINNMRTIQWERYQGVIIAHGTDTMAYTASLMALILADVPVPVVLVGASHPLDDPATNGNINFMQAVEFIADGHTPGVYMVYQNTDGRIYIHQGAHLLQCAAYIDDFFSPSMQEYSAFKPVEKADTPHPMLIDTLPQLTNPVLKIEPYVGLDYSLIRLGEAKAVLHGLYHAGTACVERKHSHHSYGTSSALHLLERCRAKGIPFFMGPAYDPKGAAVYFSAGDMVAQGALPVYGMTDPMTYVKILVAVHLYTNEQQIREFIQTPVQSEFVYHL